MSILAGYSPILTMRSNAKSGEVLPNLAPLLRNFAARAKCQTRRKPAPVLVLRNFANFAQTYETPLPVGPLVTPERKQFMQKHFTSRVPAFAHIAARILDGLPDNGHGATRRMHSEIVRLQNGAAALEKLAATRNPLDTSAAHEKRVATAGHKYSEEIKVSLQRLSGIVQVGAQDVELRIAQKVNLVPDGFAAEIRSAFRSMNTSERLKLLGELATDNRGSELAAIVKAPSILTGIDDALKEKYSQLIASTHAPDESQEYARLMDALEAGIVSTRLGDQVVEAYLDPASLASIESGESAARAADASFANALA